MCIGYVYNASDNVCPDSPQPVSHAISTSQKLFQKQAAVSSTDASCDDQSAGDIRQLDISEHNAVTTRNILIDNSRP